MFGGAQNITRHDLEAKIVKRSWEDETFRNELVSNPAGTFEKFLKIPASSLPKIVIHEEEAGIWHIVLPAKPVNAAELSEEDLEKVAGGVTPTTAITVLVSASATVSAASVSVSYSLTETLDKGW